MRKTFSLAAATCLLALPLTACDDQPDATPTPVPTTMPTAAPGRLATFLGTGSFMGWDGKAPGQTTNFGRPGLLRTLPDGELLLTFNGGRMIARLEVDGTLHGVGNHPSGLLAQVQGGVTAFDVRGSQLSLLAGNGSLITLPVTGGASKAVAAIDFGGKSAGNSLGIVADGLVSHGAGWIAQSGSRLVSVSAEGQVSPLRLPVIPQAIAADEGDLLIVTTDSLVRLRNLKIISRMPIKLLSGSVPVAVTPDDRGGAFIATGRLATIIHVGKSGSSKVLARASESSDSRRCGSVPPGDPMAAPFPDVKGLAVRGTGLLIASPTCNRVYTLGLAG